MIKRMETLTKGTAELGIELDDAQLDQFETYYREIADWNQRVNLTSIVEYEDVQVKHFLDSLTVRLTLPKELPQGIRVIDVGAGPGLPGLALKLAIPDIHLTLVDSTRKKTAFIQHVVDLLELSDVKVLTTRAEEVGQDYDLRESFDLALARGLSRMPTLLEYALPLCKVGGKVVAWKHGGIQDELTGASGALRVLGGRYQQIIPIEVPGLTDNRILVVVTKVHPTPDEYPRRTGVPSKQPL